MTRTGKIARLPRHIRDQLNRHLDDGEPGNRLVEWLNSLDEVKDMLHEDFGGRPVSEQNLSDWKQGGIPRLAAAAVPILRMGPRHHELCVLPLPQLMDMEYATPHSISHRVTCTCYTDQPLALSSFGAF
jgi:hypothetical protein